MKTAGLINGVDIGRLTETVDAIKNDPRIAAFRFRASNRWDMGGHNRTTIHDFFGAQQEFKHEQDFHLDADEPDILLGSDRGANPVEYALTALAGCLTTTLVYHAAARGITIQAVESELEGELDLRGFLGLSDQIRNGYKNIHVKFRIDADASQETLDELILMAQQRSPVFDIISNPVNVQVVAERMTKEMH